MTLREEALHMHRLNQGKLETVSKVPVRNAVDLSLAYSPVKKFTKNRKPSMTIQ